MGVHADNCTRRLLGVNCRLRGGRPEVQGLLVVDPFLCGRDQAGADSSELVAELDGLLEGVGEPVELPDDDVVDGAVVACGLGDHLGELIAGAGRVAEDVRDGEAPGQAVLAAGGFLVVCGEDAAGCCQGVPDVDGQAFCMGWRPGGGERMSRQRRLRRRLLCVRRWAARLHDPVSEC